MAEVLTRLLKLFERSVIVQASLTLGIFGVTLYLMASQVAIPDSLETWNNLLLGFYFGAKMTEVAMRKVER